jgi:acetyl esterase/lipase
MSGTFRRRTFLKSCLAGAFSMGNVAPSLATDRVLRVTVKTYTYKQVDDLAIKANVYSPDESEGWPVVVWIHGGALIMGHREGISERVKSMLLQAGYTIVSIDYRLAPETKLPEIVDDVEDALAWVREDGPKLLGIRAERIAVMGGSAGGYLTLTTGYRVQPRPTVLVSFWGYGDLVGEWYSEPSPHPRHHQVKLSREEAYAHVSGPPISDARDRPGNGGAFYQYCRQHGLWPEAVSGWNPHEEAEQFLPFMPIKNVTSDYPPTLLIHGTHDTDVPHAQSEMMTALLKEHGVDHALISIPSGEHGLDGGDPRLIDAAYESALAFVNRHMAREK